MRISFANNPNQVDQGASGIIQGSNNIDVIPAYCTGFDGETNPYQNRLQFNFNTNPAGSSNPYIASTSFRTMENTYHKLDFDLFILQEQRKVAAIPITATATVKLKQADGSLIQEIAVSPTNITYCNRHLEQVHFEFIATGEKVYLEIDIDNNGTLTSSIVGLGQSRLLYQSFEIDNLHLQAAMTPAIAFYYNDRGHRVRKEVYNSGHIFKTMYVRDVSGNTVATYKEYSGRGGALALKEQPIYGASRLGIFYRDNSLQDKGTYAYQLTDHLGNIRAVIMKEGNNAVSLTTKTDYYPFGMPMPNRNVEGNYRYGYQGQEKDPETGMEAFELRLWDSRIGRWLSPDPYSQYFSPYLGMGNNPINGVDPDGGCFVKDENGKLVKCAEGNLGDVIVDVEGMTWKYGKSGWETNAYDDRTVGLISDIALYKMLEKPLPLNHISYGINSHIEEISTRNVGLGTVTNVRVYLPQNFGSWNEDGSDGRRWMGCMSCHSSNGAYRILAYGSIQRSYAGIIGSFIPLSRIKIPTRGVKIDKAIGAAPLGFSNSNPKNLKDIRKLILDAIKRNSKKASKSKHVKPKMGNNRAANQQVTSLVKKYKLNRVQQRQLHDYITGQGYTRDQIEQIIKSGEYLM